ncbi:MAG: putative glycoside hydrolase [Ruminococcus sp.]|nr:putative glycoside hydrolase [Ruminococcus sp.]
MAFKKPIYGRSDQKNHDVRVKNSYYTFSKEYPVGNIGKQRKADRHKRKKTAWLHAIIFALYFAVIVSASYFAVDLGLKFSYKSENTPISDGQNTETATSTFSEKGIKALYMPTEKLGDDNYIKKLIGKIRVKDADSVVIDFKLQDGHLAYSSSNPLAMLGKCALFDNETVRKAIDTFRSSNINIIAGIYCFEDAIISSSNSELAVKYMNSDVTWLDKREEDGGKSWLNPYSKGAQNYIKQIIAEINKMGVNGFMLKSVSFPSGDAADTAGYPGEKDEKNRSNVLTSFIMSIKESLPSDCFLLTCMTATDALSGNDKLYSGTISKNAADGLCADTQVKPESYVVDKKMDFSSMMSLYANIKQAMTEQAKLVPIISTEEYSRRYIRTIIRGGYDSYILFNADGDY